MHQLKMLISCYIMANIFGIGIMFVRFVYRLITNKTQKWYSVFACYHNSVIQTNFLL